MQEALPGGVSKLPQSSDQYKADQELFSYVMYLLCPNRSSVVAHSGGYWVCGQLQLHGYVLLLYSGSVGKLDRDRHYSLEDVRDLREPKQNTTNRTSPR